MTEVTAQLNRLRLAPRKVRSVANLIKGKDVVKVLAQLDHLIKKPAPHLSKLLNSAIANAENNFNMVRSNLYIKDLVVNEGVKLKRFQPKGFGRASEIQKKTSHIKIVLEERVAGLKADRKASKEEHVHAHEHEHGEKPAPTSSRVGVPTQKGVGKIKTELGKKGSTLGTIGKKIFRRKAI